MPLRALRVSYAGELGWELHHPMERMAALYDAVMGAGEDLGVADVGLYAFDALRMEKGYKAWGLELTTELTPVEGGLTVSSISTARSSAGTRCASGHARVWRAAWSICRWTPWTPTRTATSRSMPTAVWSG